jgi:hypothetical protein
LVAFLLLGAFFLAKLKKKPVQTTPPYSPAQQTTSQYSPAQEPTTPNNDSYDETIEIQEGGAADQYIEIQEGGAGQHNNNYGAQSSS